MKETDIEQAMRCCKFGVPCEKCPVVGNKDCFEEVNTAAAELIERLTAENAALRETKFGLAPGPITRPPQSWRYVEEDT